MIINTNIENSIIEVRRDLNFFVFFNALYLAISGKSVTHTHTHSHLACNNKYLIFSYAREERCNLYRERAYKKSFLTISCIFFAYWQKKKKDLYSFFFRCEKGKRFLSNTIINNNSNKKTMNRKLENAKKRMYVCPEAEIIKLEAEYLLVDVSGQHNGIGQGGTLGNAKQNSFFDEGSDWDKDAWEDGIN